MFQIFQFHFYCRVISENVLVKTQKPEPCYCPDGLVVKLSDFQVMSNACTGSNPAWTNFSQLFFTSHMRYYAILILLRMWSVSCEKSIMPLPSMSAIMLAFIATPINSAHSMYNTYRPCTCIFCSCTQLSAQYNELINITEMF